MLKREVKEAWQCLRRVALHYMRGYKVTDLKYTQFLENASWAHCQLMQYAERAEALFGTHVCTYNLHTLACRGYQQEKARGPTGRENEFWLEREIQELKQRVKYRAQNKAEAVLSNDLMDTLAMQTMKAQDAERKLSSWSELLKPRQSLVQSPVEFHGTPIGMSRNEEMRLRTAILTHWMRFYAGDVSGWTIALLQCADFKKYNRCTLRRDGKEMNLHSQSYGRTAGRVSPYTLVTYDYEGEIQHFVALIKTYVEFSPPRHLQHCPADLECLCLAVVDLFRAEPINEEDADACRLLRVANMQTDAALHYETYPVKVMDIREPLIALIAGGPNVSSSIGYFVYDDPDEDAWLSQS